MTMSTKDKIKENKVEAALLQETLDEERRDDRRALQKAASDARTALQAELESEHKVEAGTILANNLFQKAWSDSHSYGLDAVRAEYEELVELFYHIDV